jgi:hypothetical protein
MATRNQHSAPGKSDGWSKILRFPQSNDTDRYFRLEWEVDQSTKRGPVITGYVYETFGRLAEDMRLAIETLDAAGAVTGTRIGYVMGTVPPGARAYFEIPVPAASAYRVRILSFRWRNIGGP